MDIAFSNGYRLENIPYYNGYYTAVGEPLLVGYPGYTSVRTAFNCGGDLWDLAGLKETDTATVTLAKAGAYADIQNARDISYEDDRTQFPSDEVFANFRSIRVGRLREDTVYRSASPCDNQHLRASTADALMGQAGVNFVLNLADTEEKLQKYQAMEDFNSPHYAALAESGKVCLLALNMNYQSEEFTEKLVQGFTAMAEQEGPYLIHCTEGKDRTGFVCLVVGALAGGSYQELVNDYMLTYANYYGITPEMDPTRYETIRDSVFLPMLKFVAGDGVDVTKADLAACAEGYLLRAGMAPEAIAALRERILLPE